MNWFLSGLALLFLVLALLLAWRQARLRRRLEAYSQAVRRAAEERSPADLLPPDESGLEELSNAVRALAATLQDRLLESESRRAELATVLERMTDGVLITDSAGRVQLANAAAERLFESPAPLGRTVAEVLRHHQLVEAWQNAQTSGEEQSVAVELPARQKFLQLFVLPDRQNGSCLLLVQDLTRVRRLETVRRDFISNVSHELRTPLASLKALTETLRDGALDDPEAARRFLGRMETEVDALAQMAQELLELTRIESGQVPLELRPVSPSALLEAAAERMRAQTERAGLNLHVQAAADLPLVQADATRLEQVLVNLIHNAVKFTPPGGEVALSAAAEGNWIRFAVRDTGVGIPADDLTRIFERFYKADRARTGGGTGLGLSISRHLVEAHGGRIWAESKEGQGSTFYFTIPCLP